MCSMESHRHLHTPIKDLKPRNMHSPLEVSPRSTSKGYGKKILISQQQILKRGFLLTYLVLYTTAFWLGDNGRGSSHAHRDS
jgi:hypothetical protein